MSLIYLEIARRHGIGPYGRRPLVIPCDGGRAISADGKAASEPPQWHTFVPPAPDADDQQSPPEPA